MGIISKYWHCILILIVGYFIGVYYPSIGSGVVSKAKSLTGQ